MNLSSELQQAPLYRHLQVLANQVVEGFISGMHKSPFHGFSSEFSEHKSYNPGESTRYIDWKLYARSDKLYTKRFEEETNLRCHLILDRSASMYYPVDRKQTVNSLNKIGFSVWAAAVLLQFLKRQRDAAGLSVYADTYEYYAPEKGGERHYRMLTGTLEWVLQRKPEQEQTKTYTFLHQIAEKMHRRSLIFLFTDMFQTETDEVLLFEALRHLRYNKHRVVLFHVMDKKTEFFFEFNQAPKRFIDVETGNMVNVYANAVKERYQAAAEAYCSALKLTCARYKIKYVEADIANGFDKILLTYLAEKQRFA